MRGNNVMSVLFSNRHDSCLPLLTAARPLSSVPFCGRYRIIDFTLSCLVHAGIAKVGIVTHNNYQSLMDHIGSGKLWGLSRKNEGLYFLPPFSKSKELYDGKIEAMHNIRPFFRNSREEYVLLSDCNVVGNIDFTTIMDEHSDSGADITIIGKQGSAPGIKDNLIIRADENNRVNDINIGYCQGDECTFGLGTYLLRKDLLTRLVDVAVSRNQMNFERDILMKNISTLNIHLYRAPELVQVIHSPKSYFDANMDLLNHDLRQTLFDRQRLIYTKLRDAPPAIYGLSSNVKNSLVADGCLIEGSVSNSIIFRDVRIAKGAKIENSIIMQGSIVCEGAELNYSVLDKDVVVRAERFLSGAPEYPLFISKATVV